MKQIIIKKYRNEPCGSTIGAHLYHYGISYTGENGYNYTVQTTEESIWNMQKIFQQAGYEVIVRNP